MEQREIPGVPEGFRIVRVNPLVSHPHLGWQAILEPDNVYGKPLDQVPIPEGEKRAETDWFREPRGGDRYITKSKRCPMAVEFCATNPPWGDDKRRIVLQPKPEPPARVWLARESSDDANYALLYPDVVGTGQHVRVTATPLTLDGPEGEALIDRLAREYYANATSTSDVQAARRRGIRAVLAALMEEPK